MKKKKKLVLKIFGPGYSFKKVGSGSYATRDLSSISFHMNFKKTWAKKGWFPSFNSAKKILLFFQKCGENSNNRFWKKFNSIEVLQTYLCFIN